MISLFVFPTLIMLILAVWRRFHQKYVNLKFKYDVYALRDELRLMAQNGVIDKDGFLFEYYDDSFSKAIAESYYITIFRIVLLAKKYELDPRYKELRSTLDNETKKIPEIQELKLRYAAAIQTYVTDQHYVSARMIIIPLIKLAHGTAWTTKKFSKWLKMVLVFPETSASEEYFSHSAHHQLA